MPRWLERAATPLVMAATFAVFLPALENGFLTVDDGTMVWRNPGVLAGLSWNGLVWAFTTWHFGMWHPLTWVSHQLDVSLFELRPAGHHFTSVLLHVLSAGLLADFLRRVTQAPARSTLVALLWALHPLRVESVAWLAERKDVLCTLFCIGALWLYAWYRRQPGVGRWLAVTAAIAAALLAKPMAVTLPFVLLLLDFWPLGSGGAWRRRVVEKLPWLALVLVTSALTWAYQRSVGAVSALPLSDRLLHVPIAYGLNLWNTVYPAQLSYLYPRGEVVSWELAAALMALAALVTSAVMLRTRAPSWTVGCLWCLGVMVPTVGLVHVGSQLTADRYTNFPHVGLFAGLVFALPPLGTLRLQRLAAMGVGALLLACGAKSLVELSHWHDSERVFLHALERDPDNVRALSALALLYTQGGKPAEGLAVYQHALRLAPRDADLLANHALALLPTHPAQALAQATRANQLSTANLYVKHTLVVALMANGRCAEAVAPLQELVARAPFDLHVERDLGICLAELGQAEQALAAFDAALKRFPTDVEAAFAAAVAAEKLGRKERARTYASEASRLAPGNPQVEALLRSLVP